jgi:hypothetical protein
MTVAIRKGRVTRPSLDVTHQPRDYRKELWIQVAVAVARAENTIGRDIAGKYADAALADFDRTFKTGEQA